MSAAAPNRLRSAWAGKAREVPSGDPLSLCGDATLGALCAYWELPSEGEAFAGFGIAGELLSVHSASALGQAESAQLTWLGEAPPVPGPWWGGVAFDPARRAEPRWADFGSARWVLPEVALARRGGRTFLLAFADCAAAADTGALLDSRLDALKARLCPDTASPDGIREEAAFAESQGPTDAWSRLVGAALTSIEEGAFSKVVVARALDVELNARFDPVPVLGALRRRHPGCAVFLLGSPGGAVFLGATPETLLRVADGRLWTEALASTLPVNATLAQAGDKDRREHQAVVDAVRDALQGHVTSLEVDAIPSLVRLARLSHLRTGVQARLRPGARLSDIALALHPTPAVAGAPRAEAMRFLQEREGFDRGWYGGLVGYLGAGEAHLRVALRSAWVQDRSARLFAGAGIVSGSVADAEWAETAVKASAMLEALGGLHARP
jgi:salicylate biosynthesis isochorismate synthase